ncbi:protein KASH5-like [Babylonia areolata]|uniref:protein KASH5-like n=1 Tax=Babylonia areolata TaxID=304850 RepID=UPI003FD0A682
MENVIVSQLLSETDLIDILFHTCDEQNTGRVPVSALITYLHKMTGSDVQHREAVQKLALCLDPEGQNRELDLVTYRHGMHTWIEQLRTQLSDHSSADPAVGLMDEKSLSNTHLANSSSPYLKGI